MQVHILPVLRQQQVKVPLDEAKLGVLLGVHGLLLLRLSLQLPAEVQRFVPSVELYGLRPDLVDLRPSEVLEQVLSRLGHVDVHGPESAVARLVPKAVVIVCRSEEHALPGEVAHALAVGHPETILLLTDEVFDRLHLALGHAGHFGHLHEPGALQLLVGVFALHGGEAVGVPSSAQAVDDRALSGALRAHQHHHVVELRPRLVDAGHRGRKHLPGHGPHVVCVRGAQVVDQ